MDVSEYVGVADIMITLVGGFVVFVYNTLTKADKDNKEDVVNRVTTLQSSLVGQFNVLKEEMVNRIDKLEENSRRDDETVKELIKEAEARMSMEIVSRIKNIVELHKKAEDIYDKLLLKYEGVLDRVSQLEGKFQKKG
jgi:hypothetical protein